MQLLPVVPELVTLDCSLTHVLQVPNPQPYHSLELDGLGLYVRSSLLIEKNMLGQAPLHYFSKTKNCRVVMPENWVSKLISHTGLWLYVGPSHPDTLSEMTKTPCKTMKIFGRSWGKNLKFPVKKDVWCSTVDIIFFNIKSRLAIARVPSRRVKVLHKSPVMTPI